MSSSNAITSKPLVRAKSAAPTFQLSPNVSVSEPAPPTTVSAAAIFSASFKLSAPAPRFTWSSPPFVMFTVSIPSPVIRLSLPALPVRISAPAPEVIAVPAVPAVIVKLPVKSPAETVATKLSTVPRSRFCEPVTSTVVAPTAFVFRSIVLGTDALTTDTVSMVFAEPATDVRFIVAPLVVPFRVIARSSVPPDIAAFEKLSVVTALLVLRSRDGSIPKLLSVKLFNDETLFTVVNPVTSVISSVAAPAAATFKVNTSIPVEFTETVMLLRFAVNVSVADPPLSTSPLLSELTVDASKATLSVRVVEKLFTPVVKVNDAGFAKLLYASNNSAKVSNAVALETAVFVAVSLSAATRIANSASEIITSVSLETFTTSSFAVLIAVINSASVIADVPSTFSSSAALFSAAVTAAALSVWISTACSTASSLAVLIAKINSAFVIADVPSTFSSSAALFSAAVTAAALSVWISTACSTASSLAVLIAKINSAFVIVEVPSTSRPAAASRRAIEIALSLSDSATADSNVSALSSVVKFAPRSSFIASTVACASIFIPAN